MTPIGCKISVVRLLLPLTNDYGNRVAIHTSHNTVAIPHHPTSVTINRPHTSTLQPHHAPIILTWLLPYQLSLRRRVAPPVVM